MTKEDIELKESKHQYNSSVFGIKYSVILLLIGLLISLFYGGKYIDYLQQNNLWNFQQFSMSVSNAEHLEEILFGNAYGIRLEVIQLPHKQEEDKAK